MHEYVLRIYKCVLRSNLWQVWMLNSCENASDNNVPKINF